MADYKPGQLLRYREENSDYIVKILESKGNLEEETYVAKILRINQDHFMAPAKVGEKFEMSRVRDISLGLLVWDLEAITDISEDELKGLERALKTRTKKPKKVKNR